MSFSEMPPAEFLPSESEKKSQFLRYVIILVVALVSAFGVVALGMWLSPRASFAEGVRLPFLPKKDFTGLVHGADNELANIDFFNAVKADFLHKKSDLVEADLSAMVLRVYVAGEQVLEVPILTKGKEGSWWETPAGLYAVATKSENHFSSFGKVYQPWSMAFQ